MTTPSKQQVKVELQLIPIRINVATDDKNLRIVETLLIDRTVWPVPLVTRDGLDALEKSLSDNAWYYARSVLADAEVAGMGRTVRHFTGRLELWSNSLLEKIHACILPQFLAAFRGEYKTRKRRAAGSISLKAESSEKKSKLEETPATVQSTATSTNSSTTHTTTAATTHQNADKSQATPSATNASTTTASATNTTVTNTDIAKDPKDIKSREQMKRIATMKAIAILKASTVPIHIRLAAHGVRVHDDMLLDPALDDLVNPIQVAESIGEDLNLPPEIVQALAVSITEQLYGLELPPDHAKTEKDDGGPEERRNLSGAWLVDQRVNVSNVAHLVALYRPPKSSSSSS